MNAGAELPFLKKSALFERLALGAAAGVTVVTPNKRLSQALMLEFDAFQIGKALSVWEAPDILPFGAFVQRLYEGGLYADLSAELPMLLTPAQEEEVWKEVVGGSGLLAVEGAAAKSYFAALSHGGYDPVSAQTFFRPSGSRASDS